MSFAAVVERLQKLANPYPGLRPFETWESHLFFGRDQQVAELVGRLERHRFLAVLGVSGSGKSSLVRAGLIPALERGRVGEAGARWRMVVTRPAGTPFESLRADLEKAGLETSCLRQSSHGLIEIARQLPQEESLLVVVDQFEELFRYKDVASLTEETRWRHDASAADAAEFVQLLLAASRHHPPVYIVVTMRSDYLGDCAEFRDLPETLNDCQYLVPRMTREQRKEAIEGPLGRVEIASSLVQRMLNDAGDEPDQLPILQHALMRTWSHWRQTGPEAKRRIELQDYEVIGGFEGALNRHADELLAGVPQEIAEAIFKRLTARGRGNRERRDPATLAELWSVCGAATPERQARVTAVIETFRRGEATFLTPRDGAIGPNTYIDITHESLIRQWKKLRDEWLPEEQLSAKTLLDLVGRARSWKAKEGELLVGLDLRGMGEWDRRRNKSTAWAEHYADEAAFGTALEFIAASQAKERQRVFLKRALWSVAAALLVAGSLVMVWTARNQELKEADERLKSETELAARSRIDSAVAPSPGRAPASAPRQPRVYIQVRSQADAAEMSTRLIPELKKAEFVVPKIEVLRTGPSTTDVRFFRPPEREGAEKIAQVVRKAGIRDVQVRYIPGYENSARTFYVFEIWLAPARCIESYVWRDAFPGDYVCVKPETRRQAAADNSQAEARRQPGGGPYGRDTCRSGYVWREASPSDLACVTPAVRAQTAEDNALASQRIAR